MALDLNHAESRPQDTSQSMAERPKDSEKAGSLPDLEIWPVSAPTFRTPSYRYHKPSGQAVVTLNGRDIYLGRYGSPETRAEFDRLLAE